jgi:hypothetical protein
MWCSLTIRLQLDDYYFNFIFWRIIQFKFRQCKIHAQIRVYLAPRRLLILFLIN